MTRLAAHRWAMLVTVGALAIFVVGNAYAQDSTATDLMARANERYERGQYAEAVQQYEALIDRGYRDAALYFNLGNAYFESGDLGRATLSYLRARQLSPRDAGVRDSLDLAHGMTVDGVVVEADSLVESVSYFGHRWATPGELGTAAILLWAACGVAIGALTVWRVFPLRSVLRAVTTFVTVVAALLLLLVASMTHANPYDNTGVVIAGTVDIVNGPGPQYPEEFALHSGAQVRLVASRQGWLQISLPGDVLRGWAPSHAIEAVGRTEDG